MKANLRTAAAAPHQEKPRPINRRRGHVELRATLLVLVAQGYIDPRIVDGVERFGLTEKGRQALAV